MPPLRDMDDDHDDHDDAWKGKQRMIVQLSLALARRWLARGTWHRATTRVSEICPDGRYDHRQLAVVGSGPAGMINAYLLSKEGYPVTVFEAFHELGGVLRYGIPEFRLPNELIDDVGRRGAEMQRRADEALGRRPMAGRTAAHGRVEELLTALDERIDRVLGNRGATGKT